MTTRSQIETEIAALQTAAPSKIAAFNERRAARLAELTAALADLPGEATTEDPITVAWMQQQDRAYRAQLRTERRGY